MTLAAIAGLLLIVMYVQVQKRSPNSELAELYVIHFGKWIGGFVGMLHALWFAYESMRNVRDVGELTMTALLTFTPKWIVMLLIISTAAYAVSKGVEVFVRVVQLLFPIAALSYTFIILLLFIARLPKITHLLPILEHGIGPVVKAAFPDLLSFPFGQMVIFSFLEARQREENDRTCHLQGLCWRIPISNSNEYNYAMRIGARAVLAYSTAAA